MLIDRTHKPWIWATALLAVFSVGLYLVLYRATPGGLTGGDLVGMAYGLAGSALMAFAGGLSFLRRVPSWWWIGPRKTWLRGHIWLSLLAGALILCHSAGRLGGPLELLLMIVVGLTLLTGVAGLVLQQFLPRSITLRVSGEVPYEQIPHLCERLRQEADDLLEQLREDDRLEESARSTLRAFYSDTVRPFLAASFERSSPLARALSAELLFAEVSKRPGMGGAASARFRKRPDGKWEKAAGQGDGPAQAVADWLQGYCNERRQFGEQERLHLLLHGWLLIHVPLSLLLLVLGLAHVVSALYY